MKFTVHGGEKIGEKQALRNFHDIQLDLSIRPDLRQLSI